MRKLVKRYQWGGTSTWGPYTIPQNNGTPVYQNLMGKDWAADFGKSAEQIMAPTNSLIDFNAKMGDPLSMSLKFNRDSNKAIQDIERFGGNSSTVTPSSGIFSKAKIGNTMNVAGGTADAVGSLIPQKEQSALTAGLNQGYDAAANAVSAIPGVGTIIGGIMKVGGMLSDGLTALGVGTDQMTTADKILDSKFLKLTPLGLVNAIGAKKADTITKDNEAFEQVGSSYGGTQSTVDDALTKSGKKYGLLSGRARNRANRQIHNAQMQQSKMSNIADEAQMAFAASNNPLLGLGNELALSGGYRNMAVGRNGMKILDAESQWAREVLNKAREVNKLQKGGKVDGITGAAPKITFESWYETVPSDRNDTTSYNLRRAFELAPKEELEAWRTSSVEDLRNGKNHLNSVYLNPKTGIYEFMKAKNHPTLKYELEWYNSKDPEAIKFRNAYDLDMSGDYYKYVPKKFAEGGKVNVIPDGALHAHKHHLENVDEKFEEVTTKGIPVITEEKGGDIKQHAEVEREEIIFNLEVTKQLEKLMQDGSDEAAIEAGKLLVYEILENTVDNTGLLNTVE
jgi:hypothetical protein